MLWIRNQISLRFRKDFLIYNMLMYIICLCINSYVYTFTELHVSIPVLRQWLPWTSNKQAFQGVESGKGSFVKESLFWMKKYRYITIVRPFFGFLFIFDSSENFACCQILASTPRRLCLFLYPLEKKNYFCCDNGVSAIMKLNLSLHLFLRGRNFILSH